jgi:hypothetical protein
MLEKDYRPFGFSSSGDVAGPLVFVGYGLSVPDKDYDDYRDIDVRGKVVLALRFGPEGSDPKSDFTRYTSPRNKARVARDKGAAALILISGPVDAPEDEIMKLSVDQGAGSSGLPVLSMMRSVVEPLFRNAGWDLRALQDSIRVSKKPRSFTVEGTEVRLTTDIEKVMATTSNILGYLEGNDPVLRNECLVLGAHMDHLGMGGKGSGSMMPDTVAIHNGADDNASGTASLLEIAQAFAERRSMLRRTLLFAFFSAEELGTLGSGHYVENPFYPLTQTVAMLNMDMVGRMQNKTLTVGGSGTSPAWPPLLNALNADSTFSLSLNPDGFGPSDHASFYGKDLPVLFFFTGVHDDYHKPSDDWDRLNYKEHEKVTRYMYSIASGVDTMKVRPPFTRVQVTAQSQGGDRRGFAVTLGIVPDVGESSSGMKVSGIRPDGPAAKAGILGGDILVRLAGKTIMNVYDYMGVLGELKPGDQVEVEILRAGKPMKLTATMQKRN